MTEQLIVKNCAPTLAGLKTGNMFSVVFKSEENMLEEMRQLNLMITKKGLRAVPLKRTGERYLIYIFRPDRLESDLDAPEAVNILKSKGYKITGTGRCLSQLVRRMQFSEGFPHEVGLFLGYPPSDVASFMRDSACGVKACGHWKAYSNEAEAEKIFSRYRKCTRIYCREINKGRPFEKLIVQRKQTTSGNERIHQKS